MPYCTNCGHDNPDGSNFCARCGVPLHALSDTIQVRDSGTPGETTTKIPAFAEERDLDALTPEQEAAVGALPRGSALLIVQRGSDAGSRFLLDTDHVTAGRHPRSDIFLDDISVSRHHATFTRTPGGTVLKDEGSLNGTYVNRDLVDDYLLHAGDEVQIGKFRLVFFASAQDAD